MSAIGDLQTTREVATRLRVSQATVKRLMGLGQIRGVRVGRQLRVDASSVAEYLDSQIVTRVTTSPRREEAWVTE